MTSLKRLQASGNDNFGLGDEIIQFLANLTEKYLNDKYATKLALANIGSEVWLGTDAGNEDLEILIRKKEDELNKIERFEIPKCKLMSNEKLQELLKKLKNLKILIADETSLSSFDFIREGSLLEYISIYDTGFTSDSDLGNLERCSNLKGLRLNITNMDLKPYSKLISSMCGRKFSTFGTLACGSGYFFGLIAPANILNSLNGSSPVDENGNFTCFASYSGSNLTGTVNFTNTGLKSMKGSLWNRLTIIIPSCFENFEAIEDAGATLDYSNLSNAEKYDSHAVRSINYENFNGYENISVYNSDNAVTIIGANTRKLTLGKSTDYGTRSRPGEKMDISEIVKKGNNISDFTIYGLIGLSDIFDFAPLRLTNLSLNNSSFTELESSIDTDFGEMAKSLTSLTINNCSSFNDLNGLNKFENITTLDLTGDVSLGNIQTIRKESGDIENKNTCQYIMESLPHLETIKLSGTNIDDYNCLLSSGFNEKTKGSKIFTKAEWNLGE